MTINQILTNSIKFTSAFKTLSNTGNLVYEYNPFRNYRLSTDMFEYKGSLYTQEELKKSLNITFTVNNKSDISDIINNNGTIEWKQGENKLSSAEAPVLRRKGELVDFETNELKFSLHHPVAITPQYSYDNSVNLIFNDGLNQPRLINSRFSATERNKYQIVDRKGDNDTNIYDQGKEFDIDTSLHKKVKTIPQLQYKGTFNSGNLSIGNYHFYFKYLDADGNESDFIAESGLVSVFIGQNPFNIHTGSRNENSHKGVQFYLKNLDSGYQYLSVYYTISTADILENKTTTAYKIDQKFLINSANVCSVKISGFEEKIEVPIEDINLQYQLFGNVEAQALCQNRLFFGNVSEPSIDYKELTDISLRFCPCYTTEQYDIKKVVDENYSPQENYQKSYYNSEFIYNKVGYWPGEIYRFGIVYVLNDGTLTPVFNTRGISEVPNSESSYTNILYKEDGERKYISYNEETNLIFIDSTSKDSKSPDNTQTVAEGSTTEEPPTENLPENLPKQQLQENCKGVVKFPDNFDQNIYGVTFKIVGDTEDDIKKSLQDLGIRGYFFVRQRRIPTILGQALTIGVDKQSHTPVIPYNREYIAECFLAKESPKLTHDYSSRTYEIAETLVDYGAIFPEYDIDYPYYNTLFAGDTFTVGTVRKVDLARQEYNKRHYYEKEIKANDTSYKESTQIQAIEDNTKLVAIDDLMFSARAGEAEEATKFEYASIENVKSDATNLLRGSYGPYLGLKGCHFSSGIINIYINGYSSSNLQNYFLIRYNDKSPFYAISDKIELDSSDVTCYRGDCYICQFTHRLNRNFQDPAAPTNDKIVDPKCWENNYAIKDEVLDTENIDKINLGDVNAVQLGQWITFIVRSTKNLNVRTLDYSNFDESALFGHSRGYFPYFPISARGVYKIPESLCYNKGFENSVSERYNFEVPDVPAIKNDFSNRISYSDIIITDAFQNGARVFKGTNYRDYPKTYGSITKLIELDGNLLCVFEHGIALIPVNERTVAGQGSGGNVYINTSNVLPENPRIISDTFGSQWRDSIIKTPKGVYGVDTIGKKIWFTNGNIFEALSDFTVQEFLNNNISLTERELTPIIGIRNVKTHYNKFKNDIMFTFYDNLYGFEEKVWNLCYNEVLRKWITFYSWVPSYSENIYNQYFSFDRNTSKWIAKLEVSNTSSAFADGVTLSNNIIQPYTGTGEIEVGILDLQNRTLPSGSGIENEITFTLERDNYGNYKNFKIENGRLQIRSGVSYVQLCSELYQRTYKDSNNNEITIDTIDPNDLESKWVASVQSGQYLDVKKDDAGKRQLLSTSNPDNRIRGDKLVILLNIRANITTKQEGQTNLPESLAQGMQNRMETDAGYYQSVVAVTTQYNMQFLTTDFWKHGQAGIIDIADDIYPTYWYGKQHPFEFEFVVTGDPRTHKIFDNLVIISNKVPPESFHYEIVGDCYDFAKDKKNMYIRQEATKELYQYNGKDITYDHSYSKLNSIPREIEGISSIYDKSTVFPAYYTRKNTINEIEDQYHLFTDKGNTEDKPHNYAALAGAEIVKYNNVDEYHIWNHSQAVDITDPDYGRLRGNMHYKEDRWDIQINPINLIQKNEAKQDWIGYDNKTKDLVPVVYNLYDIPNDVLDSNGQPVKEEDKYVNLPEGWKRKIVQWDKYPNKEVKLKDKYIKIRVRYSGEDLAIITALSTLYSISMA